MIDLTLFGTVPTREKAKIWAGRDDHRGKIRRIIRRWQRRRTSEINVLFADFGQGKSHTLLHMSNEVKTSNGRNLVHYSQLPPLTTGSPFVALYRQIMQEFPVSILAAEVFEKFRVAPMNIFNEPHPLRRAIFQLLWIIATHAKGDEAAFRWLRGESVYAQDLRSLQIGGQEIHLPAAPTKTQDCQNILSELIGIAINFPMSSSGTCVILIDEFQRVGELPPRKRFEVCNAVHLIFNSHPENLRFVLAFAGGLPGIVESVLTPDLLARVHNQINIPPLSKEDAISYVSELLAPQGSISPIMESSATELLIDRAGIPSSTLSPRRINIAFDLALNEIFDLRDDADKPLDSIITEAEVRSVISELGSEIDSSMNQIE